MKKTLTVLLSLVLMLGMLAGCGNFTDRTSSNNRPAALAPAPAEELPMPEAEPEAPEATPEVPELSPEVPEAGTEDTEQSTELPETSAGTPETEAETEVPETETVPEVPEGSAEGTEQSAETPETEGDPETSEEGSVFSEPTPELPEAAPASPDPVTDPGLTFTWDNLVRANKLSRVLTLYPSVRVNNPMYAPDEYMRLFLYGGEPVMISEGPDYLTGQVRGSYFELLETGDGEKRPVIGGFYADDNSVMLEDSLIEYFTTPERIQLDRMEGDLIWADCFYSDGFREKIAVDRGTLVLRKVMMLTENGEVLSANDFDYGDEIRAEEDYPFLCSWDRPLRTVTITWETYYAGQPELRTESFLIPQDWELLPWEGRWGEYTVYNNTDYIGDYEYPGDNRDYSLFLTTVKG